MADERELNYEKAVLCAVLEVPETFIELVPRLEPQDFADSRHASIWQGLQTLLSIRERADAVRIREMVESGKIRASLEYIEELRYYLPSMGEYGTKGAPRWAEHVSEAARRRDAREALNTVLQRTQDPKWSSDQILSMAMQAIIGSQTGRDISGFRPLSEIREEFTGMVEKWLAGEVEDKEPTGFPDLDAKIGGGLAKGQLIIVGGRPGTMKTSFTWLIARNIALRMQLNGEPGCVAFASLEMQKTDLLKRAVCAEAHVDSTLLESGRISNTAQAKKIRQATDFVLDLPIKVYDGIATSDFLHYQTLMMMAHEDVRLLVVDFAEMVADQGEGEEQRVSKIFKAAKDIAKIRHIPVIVLSQLNRQVEYDPSRMPGLQHLRWGGAGEAVADSVWFTYYPYLYQARGESVKVPPEFGYKGIDEMDGFSAAERKKAVNRSKWYAIVAKARYGSTGPVKFNVIPEYTLITDYQKASDMDGAVKLTGGVDNDF